MAGLMTKQLTQPGVEKHLASRLHSPAKSADLRVGAA